MQPLFRVRVPALRLLCLGQTSLLNGVRPEYLQSGRHPADFVLSIASGDSDAFVTLQPSAATTRAPTIQILAEA
jgi:hypothetical protein